jgi:hypothetical protein
MEIADWVFYFDIFDFFEKPGSFFYLKKFSGLTCAKKTSVKPCLKYT